MAHLRQELRLGDVGHLGVAPGLVGIGLGGLELADQRVFLGARFDRRSIVATKATCQVASHLTKLIYFGGIIDQAASLDPMLAMIAVMASMLGTTLARQLLESMSEQQFRTWANRIITVVASYYILYAGWLMLIAQRSIAAE